VSGDEDNTLTEEAGGGSMWHDSHPIVELDGSGSVDCSEELETAELPVLPSAYVTVLHDGSKIE
jgi:hypothetical protein